MIDFVARANRLPSLLAGGLDEAAATDFVHALDACPVSEANVPSAVPAPSQRRFDTENLQLACRRGRGLLAALPPRSQREGAVKQAGHVITHLMADASWRFFRLYAAALYRELTDDGTLSPRVDALLEAAAARLPGVLPTEAELVAERELMQQDKDGLEIAQGLFVSQVCADSQCGHHLLRSMLRPLPGSLERLAEFSRDGRIDLGTVKLEVEGQTAYVYLHNQRYLNSEDDTTVLPLEMAFDLVLLHPEVRMGVLRGSVVDHPKYAGRRVFCSGINLTRIYQGKQSYLSFLFRNMSMHTKLYRGLLPVEVPNGLSMPNVEPEETLEKLWVAVVESFAIGGGCQLLLVVDYVIAEEGSYFSLPARKEGILPGAANMRLPRFVGERLAREAIMFDRTFPANSPEGRMIANQVVPAAEIDQAVKDCVAKAVGSGMVSVGGNRKAIRVQTEPMETYRRYIATYAYEQAFCHLSEQLIANLERHWNAKARTL